MKKIIILILSVVLFVSCEKENNTTLTSENSAFKTYSLSEVASLNTETKRIANILKDATFAMGIHANSNFGNLRPDNGY